MWGKGCTITLENGDGMQIVKEWGLHNWWSLVFIKKNEFTHVWFLKWETFPPGTYIYKSAPRDVSHPLTAHGIAESRASTIVYTQNEKKEIGDVKTYGMFDKIHFGRGRTSQPELNGSRGVFITGPVARFITGDEVK